MPAGLIVTSDSGTIQIDSSFSTPTLEQSGNIFAVNPVTTPPSGANFITTSKPGSMLFVGNTSGRYVSVIREILSGGTTKYSFVSWPEGNVDYYLYSEFPDISSGAGYGLQVFKEDGSLYFDSSRKLLLIQDILPVSGAGLTSHSLPSGNYAALIATQSFAARRASPSNTQLITLGVRVDSDAVHTNIIPLSPAALPISEERPLIGSDLFVIRP